MGEDVRTLGFWDEEEYIDDGAYQAAKEDKEDEWTDIICDEG
jgi:hypothetical protein